MRRLVGGRGPAVAQPLAGPASLLPLSLPPSFPAGFLPPLPARRGLVPGGPRAGGGAARRAGAGGGVGGLGVYPGAGGWTRRALNWPEGHDRGEVASWGQRRPRGCQSKRSPVASV